MGGKSSGDKSGMTREVEPLARHRGQTSMKIKQEVARRATPNTEIETGRKQNQENRGKT